MPDTPAKDALRGNHLENIGGNSSKYFNPRARGSLQIDQTRASGQPVGNCKTLFGPPSIEKLWGEDGGHKTPVKLHISNYLTLGKPAIRRDGARESSG